MIRAIQKNTSKYVYIYQMYYQESIQKGFCWHFLVSQPKILGLRVMYLDEINHIEKIDNTAIEYLSELYEYQHPVLKNILEENWELYNDIIEGVESAWFIFEKRLGCRP